MVSNYEVTYEFNFLKKKFHTIFSLLYAYVLNQSFTHEIITLQRCSVRTETSVNCWKVNFNNRIEPRLWQAAKYPVKYHLFKKPPLLVQYLADYAECLNNRGQFLQRRNLSRISYYENSYSESQSRLLDSPISGRLRRIFDATNGSTLSRLTQPVEDVKEHN